MVRLLVAAVAAVVGSSSPVAAQTYPTKPIRLIVPFPPGGGTDVVSRHLATELAQVDRLDDRRREQGRRGRDDRPRRRPPRAGNEGYDMVMGQADNLVIAPAIQKSAARSARRI